MQKKTPRPIPILFTLILVMFILIGCTAEQNTSEIAGTGEVTESTLTDTVESSGSIQADQLATITWDTTGVVAKINVTNGNKVKSGDILGELDAKSVPAEVIQGFVDLANAKLKLEDAKSMSSTANAAVALVAAQTAFDDAKNSTYSIGYTIGSGSTITSTEIAIEIAVITLQHANNKLSKLNKTTKDDMTILQAQAEQLAAQQNLDALRAELEYLKSTPDALDATTINANLQLAQAQLDNAQRAYDRVKDGPNPDDIAVAQANVDAAQAVVNKLSIIAPFDGEVILLYSQPGDQVEQGENALILINREKMYVEVFIDETSISNIAVGNKATVSFDAFPGLDTTGAVTYINPIGNSSSGVVNYTVRVDLEKADPSILIGATASVTIQISEAQTTLFVPVAAVQSDAQGEYVVRVTSNGQERVSVVSGQIVDDTVVVKGDLKAGDIVQLYTTTSSASTGETTNQRQGNGGGIFPGGGMMP